MRILLSMLSGLAWAVAAAPAVATPPTVEVLETWPSADAGALPRNQNFHLRLAYRTERPVAIWVRPYYHGKPADDVGTSPSPRYVGEGETLGWFFFLRPGARVDEIRITAGDGTLDGTPVVATLPVDLVGGTDVATATPPDWVADLGAKAAAASAAARAESAAQPVTVREVWFFNGFMLAMLALGAAGLLAPAWGLWRWRGAWRVAAAVPALAMAIVLLNIVIGTAIDPTSHNLWPFEILMWSVGSVAVMAGLALVRRLGGSAKV